MLSTWFQVALDVPHSNHFVAVEGVNIGYTVWGDTNNPGIVLIHGSNAHREWWRFVAPFLSRRFRVAALDMSGNGDSGWRKAKEYSAEILAKEVWAVCQAAELGPKPTIVGHSFGGFVALDTACRYDNQITGAILLDYTVSPPENYNEWGLRAKREGKKARSTRVYPKLEEAINRFRFLPEQPPIDSQVMNYIAHKALRKVEGGWTWKFDPAFFDYLEMGPKQLDRYVNVQSPVAVLLGEYSADDGARSGSYMQEVSNGRTPIHILPNVHHHFMFEEPIAVFISIQTTIDNWLRTKAEV